MEIAFGETFGVIITERFCEGLMSFVFYFSAALMIFLKDRSSSF
jgi:hypothetical protein